MPCDVADVAIIGAGPAGAWAAYRLARGGARVRIFDGSHPREKPCGGGVTARALRIVADAVPFHQLPAVRIRSTRFFDLATGRSAEMAFDDAGLPALCVASRTVFDGQLLEAACRAGAELVRARATEVRCRPGGCVVETRGAGTHRADLVIGADGANALTRRRLAGAFRRDQLSIAAGYFVHGTSSEETVIAFVTDPPGYLWSFPRPGHLAVGICVQADEPVTSEGLKGRTLEWLRTLTQGTEARLEPYSWPIPSLSARDVASLSASGPRWMLVGDAAGLVDPVTREGIYFALLSADYAARAALADGPAPDRDYQDLLREGLLPELWRAARFKAGVFRPHFTALLIRALEESSGVRRVMANLVAGEQEYRTLKWELLKTREFALAWRLVASRAGLRRGA
jgi:geranylgeranyl reductase family protein